MRRPGFVACLATALVVAACAATPSASLPAASVGTIGTTAPSSAPALPQPSGGNAPSPAAAASPGAARSGGGSTNDSSPTPTPVPSGAPPRLLVSVTGTYRKTGIGPYLGSTDDYTFKSTDLQIEPAAGGKVLVRGRLTLTESEYVGTGLKCHGTFTATYQIATTGTIGGEPATPIYQIQIAVAHPPQDSIKLHCTTGISTSKFAHASYVAAWASLLGPIDVPELGGEFKLSGSGSNPYFAITAAASFVGRRG